MKFFGNDMYRLYQEACIEISNCGMDEFDDIPSQQQDEWKCVAMKVRQLVEIAANDLLNARDKRTIPP